MMPDTFLILGDFVFSRFEIPETIPFGGEQRLIVHELVGGVRVIDSMGESPKPIEWSGYFVGELALERALYIDGLRKAGQPLLLTWDALAYTVMIKSFHCDFNRYYRIPYKITCEVLEDLTYPVDYIAVPGLTDLILADMLSLTGMLSDLISEVADGAISDILDAAGDALGDLVGGLSDAVGALNDAVLAVGDFANAALSTVATVLQPLALVQSIAGNLGNAVGNVIGSAATFGGVQVGLSVAQNVLNLTTQVACINVASNLFGMNSTIGRMAANIGMVNSGLQQVSTIGGNLYNIAAQQYGDAMGWTAIALANNIVDPVVTGLTDLSIPPYNNQTDGILYG